MSVYAVTAANAATPTAGTLLGTVVHRGSIQFGDTAKASIGVKASLPAGTYTLVAVATDASGQAVTSSAGPTITVAASVVTLATAVGKVTPASVKAGKPISIAITVTNSGNVASTGLATLTVTIADGGTAVALTVPSRKVTIKAGKAGQAGKSVVLHLAAKVPAGTAAGTYFPTVTFSQVDGAAPAVTGTDSFVIS